MSGSTFYRDAIAAIVSRRTAKDHELLRLASELEGASARVRRAVEGGNERELIDALAAADAARVAILRAREA